MYRSHAKYLPTIPQTQEDLSFSGDLFEQYTTTKTSENRYLLFDGWQDIVNPKAHLINISHFEFYSSNWCTLNLFVWLKVI